MAYVNTEGLRVRSGSGDLVPKNVKTATGASAWVDIGEAKEIVAQLHADAGTGTSPTLDVKFQTSYNGTDATAVDLPSGAFTQVLAAASNQIKNIPAMHRFIKAVWTITGTTPGFDFGVYVSTRN